VTVAEQHYVPTPEDEAHLARLDAEDAILAKPVCSDWDAGSQSILRDTFCRMMEDAAVFDRIDSFIVAQSTASGVEEEEMRDVRLLLRCLGLMRSEVVSDLNALSSEATSELKASA
jgi:hypothetical protein